MDIRSENDKKSGYEVQMEAEERVIVFAVASGGVSVEDTEKSLDELEELLETAGAATVGRLIQSLDRATSDLYLGSGKVEELRSMVAMYDATGVVCDDELSPAQLMNLQDALNIKVMDRTMVILDIFAAHAGSYEGKLQVELAQLRFRATRLVGMRDSLSRLGGGIGTRGPGEKKLEIDRRVIRDRISKLKADLRQVEGRRTEQRKQRNRTGIPVVSIVGYTNAGKSTLLNKLTGAGVLEEDKLFATLDPATRNAVLPAGQQVLFTDTVGFIRKLPHHLVEAFKSTLEEAKYADYIIHVVDASNPQAELQMHTVYETLRELGATGKKIITLLNKQDQVQGEALRDFRADYTVKCSARTGEGLEELKDVLAKLLAESQIYLEELYTYKEAGKIQIIREYGSLLSEEYREDGIFVKARVPAEIFVSVMPKSRK